MPVNKYNIYIICKNEDIFKKIAQKLHNKYKGKICHIQFIPAEYLTLTQCNQKMLKKLKTLHNTKKKSIIAKLGCIAAHRKALLAIYSNQTYNNLILEQDADLMNSLPLPPDKTCYMGGWIVPPKVTLAGKVKLNLKPKSGLNTINYDKFKIITTHALFIKDHDEAVKLLDMTIEPEKLKPYDIFLAQEKFFKHFYYPSVFVQESHRSEIDNKGADLNYYRTYNYGLTKPKKTKKKGGNKKNKDDGNNEKNEKIYRQYKKIYKTCNKRCKKHKNLSKKRFKCFNKCEKEMKSKYNLKLLTGAEAKSYNKYILEYHGGENQSKKKKIRKY